MTELQIKYVYKKKRKNKAKTETETLWNVAKWVKNLINDTEEKIKQQQKQRSNKLSAWNVGEPGLSMPLGKWPGHN